MSQETLKRTLGPVMLWGLGVGYVISGMYFGWNLGLAEGGVLGLAIATVFIACMYVTFTLSYTELSCALPKAGGAFVYADRALGPKMGFLTGMAQNIEFIFAPPAIAYAIGAYLSAFVPLQIEWIAILAYFAFTYINVRGVHFAAVIELVITILAVVELLIFAGFTLPHFEAHYLFEHSLPHGISSIFMAIPFAIWFFLAIEGIANVAEETVNPQRNVVLGFSSAMATLVMLCVITFVSAVGVAGWEAIVYAPGQTQPSDSPLPLALQTIYGSNSFIYHLLITIGLLGLVASFHGIILVAGRSTLAFARKGYLPKYFAKIHPQNKTPARALWLNTAIGILAILSGQTGDIITLACFGALLLYVMSLISLFVLRLKEPNLVRPFSVPGYPWVPAISLSIALVALVAMFYFNQQVGLVFAAIVGFSFLGLVRLTPREPSYKHPSKLQSGFDT